MENVSDEQLEAVLGGVGCIGGTMKCPECGSKKVNPKKDVEMGKFECEEGGL